MATRSKTRQGESRDFRKDLTDTIVGLVESGTAPWQKPWNADAAGAALRVPYNGTTERPYRGANSLYLMARQMQLGSDDPRWCTYKQAQAEGWQVRKGEKGTTVEYWQFDQEEQRERPDGVKETVSVKLEKPRVFYATVFNAQQIDGIPALQPLMSKPAWEVSQAAERVLASCGVSIHHDQADSAYYVPSRDAIHLPPRESFPRQEDYYEVALHEVAHSTGHPSRLGRDLSGRFGSPEYAREELRAQMCSLYLTAELGVPFNPERHAAYQGSWVEALKGDKNEIFRAARDAELMADYVIGLSREHTLTKEIDMAETAEITPGATPAEVAPQSQTMAFTQEEHQLASNDVAAFMETGPDGAAARTAMAKDMREKFKDAPGYRAALETITPNLSTLTNARTTVQQRESLYASALEARDQQTRDDPEHRDELARMSKADMVSALEKRMKNFDWSFEYSDDYRGTAKEREELESIKKDLHELSRDDPAQAAALWDANAMYVSRPDFLPELTPEQKREAELDAAIETQEGPEQLPLGQIAVLSIKDEQRWRDAMAKGDSAMAHSIQQEAAADFAKEKGIQSGMVDAANARANGQAKLYLPRENGKYTGQIVEVNDRYALQQIRESNSFVAHPLDKLKGQQLKAGDRCLMEYQDGQLTVREPEHARSAPGQSATERLRQRPGHTDPEVQPKAFNGELVQLKNEHAGKDVKMVMAKDANGTAYTGAIIAETGDKVLQRVSERAESSFRSSVSNRRYVMQRPILVITVARLLLSPGSMLPSNSVPIPSSCMRRIGWRVPSRRARMSQSSTTTDGPFPR
ncbi:MAG: zincin-like metallopeptidase domain-containing protein [Pseudomonadota bacterium]|nr:zincin-like metallopeptidase domain-containing protein [Pseudomonadota bacterium]